jgi:serine/threonine protein kinase
VNNEAIGQGAGPGIGSIIGQRWRVLEALGPTARGEAFRVEELEKGRVGRLDLWGARFLAERGRLAQLEREARIVTQLQHPRCLALFHFGVDGDRPFYVWEPVTGKRLAEELGKPELTVERALGIAMQVLEGLRHLHAHGVVHRALTADNVILGTALTGEAVWVGPPQMGVTGDRAVEVPGDLAYQPPERKTGRPDHRGDIYAVGVLLYAMCTGQVPSPAQAGTPHPGPRSLAPERGIDDAVERIVMRAMAPSPDARFQSADDFIGALQRRSAAEPPRRRPTLANPLSRGRRVAYVVIGGLGMVLVGGVALLRNGGGPRAPAPPAVSTPPPVAAPPEPAKVAPAPAPAPAPQPVVGAPPAPAPNPLVCLL